MTEDRLSGYWSPLLTSGKKKPDAAIQSAFWRWLEFTGSFYLSYLVEIQAYNRQDCLDVSTH